MPTRFSSWNTSTPNTIASTANSGASRRIYEGYTAPLLTQFLTALTITDNTVAVTAAGVTVNDGVAPLPLTMVASAGQASSGSGAVAPTMTYDISGLNLTVVTNDSALPAGH